MLKMRRANLSDWARLYAFRNDPETRRNSTQVATVPLVDHMEWLARAISNPSTELLVFEDDNTGQCVGTARIDVFQEKKLDRYLELSLTVDSAKRGKGYGAMIIRRTVGRAQGWMPGAKIVARVKTENYISLRAFASVGFGFVSESRGIATLELT